MEVISELIIEIILIPIGYIWCAFISISARKHFRKSLKFLKVMINNYVNIIQKELNNDVDLYNKIKDTINYNTYDLIQYKNHKFTTKIISSFERFIEDNDKEIDGYDDFIKYCNCVKSNGNLLKYHDMINYINYVGQISVDIDNISLPGNNWKLTMITNNNSLNEPFRILLHINN